VQGRSVQALRTGRAALLAGHPVLALLFMRCSPSPHPSTHRSELGAGDKWQGVHATVPGTAVSRWPLMLFLVSDADVPTFSFQAADWADFWTHASTKFCAVLTPGMALAGKAQGAVRELYLRCRTDGSGARGHGRGRLQRAVPPASVGQRWLATHGRFAAAASQLPASHRATPCTCRCCICLHRQAPGWLRDRGSGHAGCASLVLLTFVVGP
jgi:hypothetical protein